MPLDNSILTRIFPIQGLQLSPRTPEGELLLGDDIGLVVALVGGRSPQGTSLLSLADDGSLKVSIQGAGLNTYSYNSGTTADDYDADNTVVFNDPTGHFTLVNTANAAIFQLRNTTGQWGAEVTSPKGGVWDYDFQCTGMRIKSAAASTAAKWTFLGLS